MLFFSLIEIKKYMFLVELTSKRFSIVRNFVRNYITSSKKV